MEKKMGSQWHCLNRDCGWSLVMLELSTEEEAIPRCICGCPMESAEGPPGYPYLEFLRVEEMEPLDGNEQE